MGENSIEHATTCPWCSKINDLATAADGEGRAPANGDITLCIGCGEWAVFDASASGGLRKPTNAEFVEIGESHECRKVRAAWVQVCEREKVDG